MLEKRLESAAQIRKREGWGGIVSNGVVQLFTVTAVTRHTHIRQFRGLYSP